MFAYIKCTGQKSNVLFLVCFPNKLSNLPCLTLEKRILKITWYQHGNKLCNPPPKLFIFEEFSNKTQNCVAYQQNKSERLFLFK